ncbi:GLUG motif-containing protein, partial [Vreelandella olivaria]|uniref:GLUG motif-containing protein n=1 Tax=Vreelandella olivaria TaxID=390919 RepID=UPI0024C3CBE7
ATANWNNGEGFNPIGSWTSPFEGTFDGLGHVITGLTVNRPTQDNIGLFGSTDSAMLRGIGLREINITGRNYVGGLVAVAANSNIAASYATGRVTGNYSVSGLVGVAFRSDIAASYATGQVTGNNYVGGLVGDAFRSNIAASYATGQVTGGTGTAGGLVGNANDSDIAASYATGQVTGNNYVGGLVGNALNINIAASYATGQVTGNHFVGGLVGWNGGDISHSHWDVESTEQSSAVGGGTGSQTNVTSIDAANRYTPTGYAHLGEWSETASGSGNWIAADAAGNPQWVMLAGSTRPFLYSEYSTTITNAHQLQLMALDLNADY